MRPYRLTFVTMLLAATPLAAAPKAEIPALSIDLTPVADGAGVLSKLRVAIRFDGAPAADIFAQMAVLADTVETSANAMDGLVFSDAKGILPVEAQDVSPDGDNKDRQWKALRPIAGAVTVRYEVRIDPQHPEIAKPQYELRAADGGLSGAGNAFLILPADTTARSVSVHWDLALAGKSAAAASSFGPAANAASSGPLRPEQISGAYYMAGKIGAFSSGPFFGAWQGKPAFDGPELMDWAARLQSYYGGFFDQRPASFGVFGRTNRLNPGSGIGLTDSFAFTFGPDTPISELEGLLAHEMVHAWIRSLDAAPGTPGGLDFSWFGEGLAVHYERLLPYRAGLISREAFLADLNDTAGRYYTNALIATPNGEIAGGFWKDTRIRVLPYDRGSLYFASVDAQIRAASGGRRSLDDIVREMLAHRRAGEAFDLALWKKLLHAELGEKGLVQFEAMLAGGVVDVPSDAFGPCFARFAKPLKRFDLGFDPLVLVTPERRVTGLKRGSAAEAAGLRNGDRILNRFPQDRLQGDQTATLTLDVERDGRRFSLTYLPRGEAVQAYQWQAVTDRADCPA